MSDDVMVLAADLKKAADEVKKIAETTNTEIKNLGEATAETKLKADEALSKHTEISDRLTEIEQKMVRGAEKPERRKSIGQMVSADEGIKALMANKRGTVSVEVKAIISALTTDANGSAGDLIDPDRRGLIAPAVRRFTIRDLLAPGRTSSNAVQYIRESGFTNEALGVSETAGGEKPQSEIKFALETSNVATIAHWVHATKQILDDVPMLESYIDGRLRYGLAFKEETELLNGTGGAGLSGLVTNATAFSAPTTTTAATKIDVIRLAMLQTFLAEWPADGIVLNPRDWAGIEMLKDLGQNYLMANPASVTQKMLWGLPVVDTQAMTNDNFLVGAFGMGAQIFDREDANVEISTEDRDNFIKNLVTIRAEERLALAIYRPEAFITGDFTTAVPGATTQ